MKNKIFLSVNLIFLLSCTTQEERTAELEKEIDSIVEQSKKIEYKTPQNTEKDYKYNELDTSNSKDKTVNYLIDKSSSSD